MKRISVVNLYNGRTFFNDVIEDQVNDFISHRSVENKYGRTSRWVRLELADEFEKLREDDRRETLIRPEVLEHTQTVQDYDLEGNPIGEPYEVTVPYSEEVYMVDIHVPDDFTIEITDITAEYEAAIKTRKNQVKKQMATDAIIFINGIIDEWTISEKVTLLGRQDIQVILNFLNYGSISQSRDLCASLVTDSLITQEIKDNILNFLDLKIAEFDAMVF